MDRIVGTWDCESLILDGDEVKLATVQMSLRVNFTKAGTWTAVATGMDNIPFLGGTYTISDTKIVLKQDGVQYSWDIRSITGSRAEFLWPDQEYLDNDEVILVFVK